MELFKTSPKKRNCSFKGLEIRSLRKLAVELTTEICVLCSPLLGFEVTERTAVSHSPCLFRNAQLVDSHVALGFVLSLHDVLSHFGKHLVFVISYWKGQWQGYTQPQFSELMIHLGTRLEISRQPFTHSPKPSVIQESICAVKYWTQQHTLRYKVTWGKFYLYFYVFIYGVLNKAFSNVYESRTRCV
jgi:hypothetical protein